MIKKNHHEKAEFPFHTKLKLKSKKPVGRGWKIICKLIEDNLEV